MTRILGLSCKIGVTSSLIVELWVVCGGLSLAWKLGYGTLEIDFLWLQESISCFGNTYLSSVFLPNKCVTYVSKNHIKLLQ